jgi:hypothetical protein
MLYCTDLLPQEGELVVSDWRARGSTTSQNNNNASKDDDAEQNNNDLKSGQLQDDALNEYVKWVGGDHCRPCNSLEKSPFFPGMHEKVQKMPITTVTTMTP